jgi:hypothetical protein
MLREVFGSHPLAVQACIERNAVPKVRAYRDHIFVVLHAPELGTGGHVHYVELDQFIGPRSVVSVHGPVNPAVPPEAALGETRAVLGRIEGGRLRPRSAFELSYAIVSALAQGQEAFVETVTREVWPLEQRVTSGHLGGVPIKWLGDGVMVHFREPAGAVRSALDLVAELPEAGLPPAHVGVAAGPVVIQGGDYFGRAVNLAARIAPTPARARSWSASAWPSRRHPRACALKRWASGGWRGSAVRCGCWRPAGHNPGPLHLAPARPRRLQHTEQPTAYRARPTLRSRTWQIEAAMLTD